MSATIPTTEPTSFVQADTVQWTMSVPDYLPTDGWTLTYSFVKSGTAPIDVTATDNGDNTYLITIASEISETFAAGTWGYQAIVDDGAGERHTVRTGEVTVIAVYSEQSSGYDFRSTARQMLDLVEALIIGKLTRGDVASYSISTGTGSRSLATLSMTELRAERSKLRLEVMREEQAERIKKGLGSGRRLLTRFEGRS